MKFSMYRMDGVDSRLTQEVETLFLATFSHSEGEQEGRLIADLARDLLEQTKQEDLYLFTATDEQVLAGSILFSRLTFETRQINAFLLAPVAISTSYQGKQIGQSLIRYGLEQLKAEGVEWVFTYGDPNFYTKTGFYHVKETEVRAPHKLTQPEGWLGNPLQGNEITVITEPSFCVDAINKPEFW